MQPTILLSALLAKHHTKTAKSLCQIFDKHGVKYEFLETKDIWMRDFMPILLDDGRLISYDYDPDYLKDEKYSHLRTKIQPLKEHINLVLDGGNFVRLGAKAIMTDKIFRENPSKTKTEIVETIKQKCTLNELIIIPKSKSFNDRLTKAFKKSGLDVKFMKYKEGFFTKKRDWGAYLNFIKIKGILIVPIYGIDDDDVALEQIKKFYSSYRVETINLSEIIELGGALHCITAEKFER